MTPAPVITSTGGWISFYAELPALNFDLSDDIDHPILFDHSRIMP